MRQRGGLVSKGERCQWVSVTYESFHSVRAEGPEQKEVLQNCSDFWVENRCSGDPG